MRKTWKENSVNDNFASDSENQREDKKKNWKLQWKIYMEDACSSYLIFKIKILFLPKLAFISFWEKVHIDACDSISPADSSVFQVCELI